MSAHFQRWGLTLVFGWNGRFSEPTRQSPESHLSASSRSNSSIPFASAFIQTSRLSMVVAPVDPVVKQRHHLHGDARAVLQGPPRALVAIPVLQGFLQDELIGASMLFAQISFFVHAEIFDVFLAQPVVFREARAKILGDVAKDLLFQMDGEALGQRDVDP